jgi:DNA-binding NtrC family response regulator
VLVNKAFVLIYSYKRAFGTIFALMLNVMVSNLSQLDEINVLASEANWAWPEAVRYIFRPRGVNLLVAENANEFINILERKRIHTAIIDMDSEGSDGLATIKIIRMDFPLIPCILLSSSIGETLLGNALRLDVFSVIDKPVDMHLLQEQLNRLFIKKYRSDIFAQ